MKKLIRMKLINWHKFTDEIIEFDDSNLLSGENGAGKSTLLDAMQFVVNCSTNNFNKAAHENGKRKLTGYIRCKTGRENQPYERNGEISAHVALEFYEEKKNKSFIVGAVVDSASEGQEKVIRYLIDNCNIKDEMFKDGRTPKSINQFRTSNNKIIKQWCSTEKDARNMIKNRFGRIEDKFFKLIPKALAFRPIDDIKDFVYSYVLDEKEVNIEVLRENVRTYQDLQRTLENVKIRIEKLEKIIALHDKIKILQENDMQYEYYLERSTADILGEKLELLKKNLISEENKLKEQKQLVFNIKKEIESKQQLRDALKLELSNDKDFIAKEEQQRKLDGLKIRIERLEDDKKSLLNSVRLAKNESTKLLDYIDEQCLLEYIDNLNKLENLDTYAAFVDMLDMIMSFKKDEMIKRQKLVAELNINKTDFNSKKIENDKIIDNLKKKKLSYPAEVNRVISAIKDEFNRINRRPMPRILCEVIDISDESWRNAVEGFLNTQRFYIIVEPNNFDIALGVYDKLRKEKAAYGVGLINTQKLEKYDKAPEGSLATVVTSDNKYAKYYINMILGKVMMCNSYSELKNYKTSITKECMKYNNHVANAIKPQVFETPYIGQNAYRVQLEQAEKRRNELIDKLTALKNEITTQENILGLLGTENDIDIKYKMNCLMELRNASAEATECRRIIKELEENSNMIMKNIQLNELEQNLSDMSVKSDALNRQLGNIEERIKSTSEDISNTEISYEGQKDKYIELSINHDEFATIWSADYEKIIAGKKLSQFYENYDRRRKANYTTINNSIDEMKDAMMKYNTEHDFGAPANMDGYIEYEATYEKYKNSELLKYEGKVESARAAAEEEFREQFLAKLQENMKLAQSEFKELNKALSGINFSNETYEFKYMASNKYRSYYDMIMDDFNAMQGESIFSGLFHENHKAVIDELFERLALDSDNNAKALDEFIDYRTYMDYDIVIRHNDGSYSFYSKVCEEKSGGETQTPFYVTVAASFVQLYKNNIGGESVGLIMFDEAFNNMDDERIGGVLEFLGRLPLQIIIAAPPDKIQYISPFVKNTLLVMSEGRRSYVENYVNGGI